MELAEARLRVDALRRAIRHHDHLYYIEARPEISDREYDRLYAELRQIEADFPELVSPDSPTQRVSGSPIEGFETRRHAVPMMSLDNTYNDEDLRRFHEYVVRGLGTEDVGYTVEPKVDGVSISVRYEDGVLTQALTRGNGIEGDDVTANIRTIASIPLRLHGDAPPAILEVRGEVFMSREGFSRLNAERETAGEARFANPRNATAGTLKQLDPAVVATRPLECVFYGLGETAGIDIRSQVDCLETLRRFGLRTQGICPVVVGLDAMRAAVRELGERRHAFPYEIDGAVIKVNDFEQRNSLGSTAKAPSWAKAFKYAAVQAETVLRDITIQVGRTGILTPVAELEPVLLAGSTIGRATLHNEDEIRRKDIRIGDTVVIEKAGDVIPAVVGVVLGKRPPGALPFDFTAHIGGRCPSCGGAIARDPQFVAWRCGNLQCPAQSVRRIQHFAARNAVDIEALGGVVAERLVEQGLVAEPLDLFGLRADAVAGLNLGTEDAPRVFGAKNAAKLVEAVERARSLPLERWLHALGIPDVGSSTAFHVARVHADLAEVANSAILRDLIALMEVQDAPRARRSTPEPAADIDATGRRLVALGLARPSTAGRGGKTTYVTTTIGAKTARSILDFFASSSGAALLTRLEELGIRPQGGTAPATSPAAAGTLSGKTFVLTGTLESMGRDEARERIRALGGAAADSVSRNTTYLVAGANTGARKTQKAAELGVRVLDEKAFLALLEGQASANPDPVGAPVGEEPKPGGPRQLEFGLSD